MRLINARTVELEEFAENAVPPYAILSHTWDHGEVSFQDMLGGLPQEKLGYIKIQHSCKQALQDGLDFVWIDTCCIDKTSSAELSEAINSMYTWYAKAEVCYAFLADLESSLHYIPWQERLGECRWFSRGWTLQELIAPRHLTFYAKGWVELGSREKLRAKISQITKIDESILERPSTAALQQLSIATRMSWASNRTTTRVEDIAYCLLGVFKVNMPLLYGEGERAFTRLQEEIMKGSDDHSLFAWWFPVHDPLKDGDLPQWKHTDMLAPSPKMFADSAGVVAFQDSDPKHYTMTNRGLQVDLCVREDRNMNYAIFATAILNCHLRGDLQQYLAFEIVKRGYQGGESAQWSRLHNPRGGPLFIPRTERAAFKNRTMFIKHKPAPVLQSATTRHSNRSGGLLIPQNKDFTVVKVESEHTWDDATQTVQLNRLPRTSPILIFFRHNMPTAGLYPDIMVGQIVTIMFTLGFDQSLRPLKKSSTILGIHSSLEDAIAELERVKGCSMFCDVPSLLKFLEYDSEFGVKEEEEEEEEVVEQQIRYQSSYTTSKMPNVLDSVDFEIHLDVKEEEIMGQQMWVAELWSAQIHATEDEDNIEKDDESARELFAEHESKIDQTQNSSARLPGQSVIYRPMNWNNETITKFDGDELKMKNYASQEQVKIEIDRREREIEGKARMESVEEAEEEFADVPQWSYYTGIRDFDHTIADEQERSFTDEQEHPVLDEEEMESKPVEGSWFGKRMEWMSSFF
jgi:hypothetical protein